MPPRHGVASEPSTGTAPMAEIRHRPASSIMNAGFVPGVEWSVPGGA